MESVNIPNALWEQGVITKKQGESEEMASSWDEDGSPNFPYKIYDGDMETKWCTQSEDISWLKIDFVEPRLVEKFVVYMAGNGRPILGITEETLKSGITTLPIFRFSLP